MFFSRVSFALPSLAACALLVACVAPGAELSDVEDVAANEPAIGEADLAAAGWGNTSTGGNGSRKWTPKYAEAVATAQAFAENGSTAEATATAFIDTLKRNGYWRQSCAANAIAVAEAVAIDSCTGAVTVARAVASVTC